MKKTLPLVLAVLLATTASAETFPGEPFNGLQITYSVSGASLEAPHDEPGFTWVRTMNGTLTGDTLTVTGTVSAKNGYSGRVSVSVAAGGKTNSYSSEGDVPWSDSFIVAVPVPDGATSGSFRIGLTGSYNAGGHGVTVVGNLGGGKADVGDVIQRTHEPPSLTSGGSFEIYREDKNYCGPEGKLSGPNKHLFGQASFNYACYFHDKCYHECEQTRDTQDYCDTEFKRIMYDECNQQYDDYMRRCEAKSRLNPMRYACKAETRLQASTCWAQARSYHTLVSWVGKPIGSYKCDDSKWA